MGTLHAISRIPFRAAGRELRVPQPTPEDEDWARCNVPFRPKDFSDALAQAVTEYRQWRVAHLVEKHFPFHYVGRDEVDRFMATACKADNPTAVRTLLHYVEKGERTVFTDPTGLPNKDLRDIEVRCMAFEALHAAALHQSDSVMELALGTLRGLSPDEDRRGVRHFSFVYLACSAIAAAANNGRTDYLDIFLAEGAWPDRFRQVYADNLRPAYGDHQPRMRLSARAFEPFMAWMTDRGIANAAFRADPVHNWSQAPMEFLVYLKPNDARMFRAKEDLPQFDALRRTVEQGGARLVPGRDKNITDIFNLESTDGRRLSMNAGEALLAELKERGLVEAVAVRPLARLGEKAAPALKT